MADAYVGNRAKRLDISPEFVGYSRVVIYTGQQDDNGNDLYFAAGNTSGRTLEMTNPWATQAMANNVLARVSGWVYQPYEAEGARLNPAAEMGDSVTVKDIYSGIYSRRTDFTSLYKPTITAPYDEEIDHEYTYESPKDKKYVRELNDVSSALEFYAGQITAKVSKTGGNTSSFGWTLTDSKWSVYSNNTEVFKVDSSGATIQGTIKATGGTIGGFTIGSNAIYKNISSFGGTQTTGVYVGTNGIQCGSGFKVDAAGNITASSGTFSGNVYAKNIQYGGSYGTFSGSGITGSSISTGQLVGGIKTSLGYADFANDVFNKRDRANYCYANWVVATKSMSAPTYYVDDGTEENPGGGTVNKHTHFVTVSGTKVTIGAPDFSGAKHSFNIAPSATNVTISLDGNPTYQSSMRRYEVPIRVTGGDGAVIARGSVFVGASAAYGAGQDSVDVEWSEGDWDIWIYPYYYDSWEEINGGLVHTRLTNGKERSVRINW